MTGKFIGKSSMGFVTGRVYRLQSRIRSLDSKMYICLYDISSDAWCPYESLETILKNWEFHSN